MECVQFTHYLHDNAMQTFCIVFRLSENVLQIFTFPHNYQGDRMNKLAHVECEQFAHYLHDNVMEISSTVPKVHFMPLQVLIAPSSG